MLAVRLLRDHPAYRRVLLAHLVSLSGDWAFAVGLTYAVYAMTGSTVASGMTLLAAFLPQIGLASVAGVLADRWDRRTVMVVADLAQAVALLPLLAVNRHRIWLVWCVALVLGAAEQFFLPAQQALVPSLVPTEDLLAANALNGQARDVSRLVGSSLGGLLAAAGGLGAVAVANAATFVVSALLVVGVPRAARIVAAEQPRLLASWRAGLALMRGSRGLRVVLAFGVMVGVGEGVMSVLMAPWVRDVVHADGRAYGLLYGVQAVGGVLGGLVATTLAARAGARAMFAWGAVVFGLLDTCLFVYPVLWPTIGPALVVMAFVGIPGAVATAGRMTVIQRLADDEYRGRVFGALGAAQGVAVLAGIGAASWLGEVVGVLPVIVVQGFGYVAGGVLVAYGLRQPSVQP